MAVSAEPKALMLGAGAISSSSRGSRPGPASIQAGGSRLRSVKSASPGPSAQSALPTPSPKASPASTSKERSKEPGRKQLGSPDTGIFTASPLTV